jgi:hypothetical protein
MKNFNCGFSGATKTLAAVVLIWKMFCIQSAKVSLKTIAEQRQTKTPCGGGVEYLHRES